MAYEIGFSHRAARAFSRLTIDVQRRLIPRIDGLADEPRPSGCEKLTGAEGYRIRVGDYRVVFVVDDQHRSVLVTRIGHRRDVYRQL